MSFSFRPAQSFAERRGLFIGLTGGTNSGKTYSAMRLGRGIAGPQGKLAVLDTEGGRTLHLKQHFQFDANIMDPPFRPKRFAEAARAAEDGGYDALLIDSFSMEWVGLGGVLDWQEAELQRMAGDDLRKRERAKMASWINPKVSHKAMVYSMLQRRIPIIFAIRGEETVKPGEGPGEKPTKIRKAICNQAFPFEVTVSFWLDSARKGYIDLSDPKSWKMEADHRAIFSDGDLLSEEHGAKLAAWARGELAAQQSAGQALAQPSSAQSAKSDAGDFWSRDDLLIPVKPLEDGSGSDWPAWHERMLRAAMAAPDEERLDKLLADNRAAIDGLEKALPAAAEVLRDKAAARRDHLRAAVGDLLGAA